MDPVYRALIEALEASRPAALATIVKTMGSSPREAGAKMLVYPDGAIVGSVGGGEMEARVIQSAQEAIREGQPRYLDMTLSNDQRGDPLICGGEMEIFVEPLLAAPTLVIVGAGHIGAACAQLGKTLGFHVIVIDDRPEFTTPERVPWADERRTGDLAAELSQLSITPQTYVVLVTRAHTLDTAVLRAAVAQPAAYIGLLGSRRRVQVAFDALKQEGLDESLLERVHAPIGLDIGAETPAEIAVSILAEIIAQRRKSNR